MAVPLANPQKTSPIFQSLHPHPLRSPPPPTLEGPDYAAACTEVLGSDTLRATRMYKNLHKYVDFQFKICNVIHSIYYRRDPETSKVYLEPRKFHLNWVKMNVSIHWIYMTLTSIYYARTMGITKISERLLAFAFICAWIICGLMQTEFWRKRKEALFMYKNIVEFEDKYLPVGNPKKLDPVAHALMILGIVSSFGLPGCMIGLLLIDPCRPPHLGYVFFRETTEVCAPPNILAQLGILGADVYMWTIALPHGFFYVFQALLVGIRTQYFYLVLLRSGQNRNLKSLHGRKKDFVCLQIYQEMQILNKLFNGVFQSVFFPGVIAVGLVVAIVGLFAVLKLNRVIPFPAILFFPIIASDGLSIIFIAKIAALVFIQSTKFLETAGKSGSYKRNGVYRKKLKALTQNRTKFGGNFVDAGTPLVFLDFWVSQTVSLMMLTDN